MKSCHRWENFHAQDEWICVLPGEEGYGQVNAGGLHIYILPTEEEKISVFLFEAPGNYIFTE
jgi:hypothetical protein